MTKDRELLEAAAKAGGIVGDYECWAGQGLREGIRQVINGAKCHRPWNPLTDDGDALRLAVALKMNVVVTTFGVSARCDARPTKWVDERCAAGSDYGAAARRAIVRAAASLGGIKEGGG